MTVSLRGIHTSNLVPASLLSSLPTRDVGLWIYSVPAHIERTEKWIQFLGLPWRFIVSHPNNKNLIADLGNASTYDPAEIKRRGYIYPIQDDPSQIKLPEQCVPAYIFPGDDGETHRNFHHQLFIYNTLEHVRRSTVRDLIIFLGDLDTLPKEIEMLWSSGFRANLHVISSADILSAFDEWKKNTASPNLIYHIHNDISQILEHVSHDFSGTFSPDRITIKVRDLYGQPSNLDITDLDDPERPVLADYHVVQAADATPINPNDLSHEEFLDFFRDPTSSWRPYQAGLPWYSDFASNRQLKDIIRNLDISGSDENKIAYITSEPGAGGTTLAHNLAWEMASQGYPTLVAKKVPFTPNPVSIGNFLKLVSEKIQSDRAQPSGTDPHRKTTAAADSAPRDRRYETPWILVFDRVHWDYREGDLRRFCNDLKAQGRPVCVIVVSGPVRPLEFFDENTFKELSNVRNTVGLEDTLNLGRHLNGFLKNYGQDKPEYMWKNFYSKHTPEGLHGLAVFWVSLSFWIRGLFNQDETLQTWLIRYFRDHAQDFDVATAVLEIAAMSTEGLPLAERLLPTPNGDWPVSHLLEDNRQQLGALGLVRVTSRNEKYWAITHDIIGRLIINGIFYDYQLRGKFGFDDTTDSEHFRFTILRNISRKRLLGDIDFRDLGEEFATTLFKIDPENGKRTFAPFWREVLKALGEMPAALKDTSRVFRHHAAISRRRIATALDPTLYGISLQDQLRLLDDAISDIKYALDNIAYEPGSESNLNLYNSLARAYINLADIVSEQDVPGYNVVKLRHAARDATKKAYEENPTSSYVIETFVNDLLQDAKTYNENIVPNVLDALDVIFSAFASGREEYRPRQLGQLADQALSMLLKARATAAHEKEPQSPQDVLVSAWVTLSRSIDGDFADVLEEADKQSLSDALDILRHPAGSGNVQVLRLSYEVLTVLDPLAFKDQIAYLEPIVTSTVSGSPQKRLEYAILLYQVDRAKEGDRVFAELRKLWRETEFFVSVPDRLRWLLEGARYTRQTVSAVISSDRGHRAMARVYEFGNVLVPFRPEEFSFRRVNPGERFTATVSFGHNGPFLRPVTVNAN